MTCYQDAEDDKNDNGNGNNKIKSKNHDDDERKVGPGTPRTQVTNQWAMSMIEDNSATPRDPSLVRAWMESYKYGEYEKSRNMINVPLSRVKTNVGT